MTWYLHVMLCRQGGRDSNFCTLFFVFSSWGILRNEKERNRNRKQARNLPLPHRAPLRDTVRYGEKINSECNDPRSALVAFA